REGRLHGADRLALVQPMHHRIGIMHWHAGLAEKAGRGRLAHADRAGEAEDEHPSPVIRPRRWALAVIPAEPRLQPGERRDPCIPILAVIVSRGHMGPGPPRTLSSGRPKRA